MGSYKESAKFYGRINFFFKENSRKICQMDWE